MGATPVVEFITRITCHRTIPMDEFECINEAAFSNTETSETVIVNSKANWVFTDLFPVL